MFRLRMPALNLTQDGSSGQDNGPERWGLLEATVVRYGPGTSGRGFVASYLLEWAETLDYCTKASHTATDYLPSHLLVFVPCANHCMIPLG